MQVSPWQPTEPMIERLADPVITAETAGLEVIAPALRVGYDRGFAALPAMSRAVADSLTDDQIRRAWARAANESNRLSRRHWAAEAKRAGILDRVNDPQPSDAFYDAWRAENEERYERLREDVEKETRANMRRSLAAGIGALTLAAILLSVGLPTYNGRMRGRAAVISDDQFFSLAGAIARRQQLDAGIERFQWHDANDSKVRASHAALDGEIFEWSKPPAIGYPGQPIQCRCTAFGIVD